jgi:pyrimidine-nucleoside phosphorylase
MSSLNPVELIVRKREGGSLTPEEIRTFVNLYTAGEIPDYQVSAFLMAAFIKGLDDAETAALTDSMLFSGSVLDLSDVPGTKVDKHSTGGVGDKVSLILAPIVAACGVPVPMISGRGLGHTGGTLDKLESIPGFRVDLDIPAYRRQLADIGVVMIGQTAEIAPADRKLYALRDVTGTVEFIPFISASIMSKKLAEGIDALVLDVKTGRGAFMKTEAQSRRLAETLVGIGLRFGKPTVALLTRMDVPLGRAIGNWPEVAESVACLRGEQVDDLMEVTLALAGEMIWLGGQANSPEEGIARARASIDSGEAMAKFIELVRVQGGDAALVESGANHPDAHEAYVVRAPDHARGVVTDIDALALGHLSVALGAGRIRKEDPVDPAAGIVLHVKPGEAIEAGQPLAEVFTADRTNLPGFASSVLAAFRFGDERPQLQSLIVDRFTADGWMNL